MLRINVFHKNTYWASGLHYLLNEFYIGDKQFIQVVAELEEADIIITDYSSWLTYFKNTGRRQIFILIHDVSLLKRKRMAYEKHDDTIYSDDSISELRLKLKGLILGVDGKKNCINSKTVSEYVLTEIENMVIYELAKGVSPRVLGQIHNMTVKRISYYKRNAMKKLDVISTKQLLDLFR